VYVLIPAAPQPSLLFLLAVICSRLMAFYFGRTMSDRKETFPKIKGAQIKKLPIARIDWRTKAAVARHDQAATLADRQEALQKKLSEARTGNERSQLQRQIAAVDRQIDRLVYELYGLTEEEIRIVEEATEPKR
jgi:hypothetical protein